MFFTLLYFLTITLKWEYAMKKFILVAVLIFLSMLSIHALAIEIQDLSLESSDSEITVIKKKDDDRK